MIRLTLLLAFAGLPAHAFTASNDMLVQPTGEAAFAVPYHSDSAATAFWCAAGDYVVSGLGQRGDTVIYRTSAVPRRSGQPMTFSLMPAYSAGNTGLAVLGSNTGGMSAGLAQTFCTKMGRH